MSLMSGLVSLLSRAPGIKRIAKDAYQCLGALVSDKKSWPDSIRLLSTGQGEHLFGYYDKTPWNSQGDAVYLRVRSANRHSASRDEADIVLSRAQGGEQVIAKTTTWNSQQGCMLQWYAGRDDAILFNDFRDNQYCGVIVDDQGNVLQTLPAPVYSLSPDGQSALTLDFSRLHSLRPGYGYMNQEDLTKSIKCPEGPAITRIDVQSRGLQPLYTYEELVKICPLPTMEGAYHKVNHIMVSPSGQAFMFLHRWILHGRKFDRLRWARMDGREQPRVLLDEGMVSHSNWRDEDTIITYANALGRGPGYCLVDVSTGQVTDLSAFFPATDGHPSYSPGLRYVLTDSYPDFHRKQSLYLVDMRQQTRKQIASLYAPGKYRNDTRCDLHPRWSPDGRVVCFDACKDGRRQVYSLPITMEGGDSHGA